MEPAEGRLYHLTPLHYLPHVFRDGALYPKSVLAARGIQPRRSAVRRDRMLGLADWIHLSLRPDTPLLRHKLALGYPHALLVFDRPMLLARQDVALLPYNTKAWRTRSVCGPVTDPEKCSSLLRRHAQTGRFPSLEVLVHYGLDLTALIETRFATEAERQATKELFTALSMSAPAPLVISPSLLPPGVAYRPTTLTDVFHYFASCRQSNRLLPPPPIPFD